MHFSAISHTPHGQCRLSVLIRIVHAGRMYEDEISRTAFADQRMVRHLLALLPAEVAAALDMERLRPLPAEQIGRGARRRVADMAFAVGAPTPQRLNAEALLVVEFQSTPNAHMALRMDAYVALLRQEMAAQLPAAAGLLPVLTTTTLTSMPLVMCGEASEHYADSNPEPLTSARPKALANAMAAWFPSPSMSRNRAAR